MERFEVMQRILDLYPAPRYLEIGVNEGLTFNRLHATEKTAVDPQFLYDVNASKSTIENRNAQFHQVTSDMYFAFAMHREIVFDVIYLDGLHTFDQTSRDLFSALHCLADDGTIVIDDVIPSSYEASLPDQEDCFAFRRMIGGGDRAWMGDVYKLVFLLKDYFTGLTYRTLRENHGQTVVWRQPRSYPGKTRTIGEIAGLSFADAMIDMAAYEITDLPAILDERKLRLTHR